MELKGIIDCDFVNYKQPVLTLEFPYCTMKCDKLNGRQVCQNSSLAAEPNIEVSGQYIWERYIENPLTKGFCLQGLEPFDSFMDLAEFLQFIRVTKKCCDPIIIYTGYNKGEDPVVENTLYKYSNIIVKWGRYVMNQEPHYDKILGINLASNNQYAEAINYEETFY